MRLFDARRIAAVGSHLPGARRQLPSAVLAALLMLFLGSLVHAHDASTYGGMFRSRDNGQSWFSIDTGVFFGGALGLAVHPVDRNLLLLATDAGLLRSGNGGRDWQREAHADLDGPVFAVSFDTSGQRAWAATTHKLLWLDATNVWHEAQAPADALPAQAVVASSQSAKAYLVGLESFFVSHDAGHNWVRSSKSLPEGEIAGFARAIRNQHELLFLVINAALWISEDGAQTWHPLGQGLPAGKLDAIFVRATQAGQMHALAQTQLYASEDYGATWRPTGKPVPEAHLAVRGLAASVDGKIILMTTHKGLYRSEDSGESWVLKEGNLPIHLEAGPLAIDPHDANTYYAGYALTPYGETWQRAAQVQQARETSNTLPIWLGALLLLPVLLSLRWYWKSSRAERK